jgi:2-polyprenyl-6-methoxyphenol hydroxylase-like FAD-dependent oxidoreductase
MSQQRVIILGGGYAGMLAAQVLSNHFEHVILVERFNDFFESTSGTIRKGIPQAYHLHVLLQKGQEILQTLFPNLLENLKPDCLKIDWALDTKWCGPYGIYPQYPSKVKTMLFSRAHLDKLMRERINSIPNLEILIGEANQFFHDEVNNKIIGVQIKNSRNELNRIDGDLIIDARGRRSTISQALTQLGYTLPAASSIKNELGYATRMYHLPAQHDKHFKQFYLQVYPGLVNRGVVLSPIENNYFLVTLIGIGKDQPPKDNNDFVIYLDTMPDKELHEILKYLTPVTDTKVYRNMSNLHHHFGKTNKWPKGLIVLGDAACVLNPVYGQGMTVATKEVLLLKKQYQLIKNNPLLANKNWEHNFQKQIDKQLSFPWLIATAEDQRTTAPHLLPRHIKFMHWYFDCVLKLAVINPKIHALFLQVLHMLRAPYILFKPTLLFKILLRK